jgi:hypothetical protein
VAAILVIAFSATQDPGAADGHAAASLTSPRQAREVTAPPRAAPEKCRKAVRYYRSRYVYWTRLKEGAVPVLRRSPSSCYLAHVLQRKAHAARKRWEVVAAERRANFRLLYEKWRCIHEHEGAWNSNTGNGYWGGLQMDWGFMHTYGPEFIRRYGLANRWPVWAQLVAAERAYDGFAGFKRRGFSPWGTRGMCGL